MIRIGVGGWTFAPWRGTFYPPDLVQKRELEYASRKLSSIEINGTYYGSQKPASFAKWHDETPDDFIFALKGPRFTTTRRVLAEAGASIERFFASGVMALQDKLGPVNWQLMPTKRFDPEDFERFLTLLPRQVDGRPIRHAVEVRHDSFQTPEVVALAREQGVALVTAGDSDYPQIADVTAPFVYARIMGTTEDAVAGYSDDAIATWVERARTWASGGDPPGLQRFAAAPADRAGAARGGAGRAGAAAADAVERDVFIYIISGFKVRNPAAAMAMIDCLG